MDGFTIPIHSLTLKTFTRVMIIIAIAFFLIFGAFGIALLVPLSTVQPTVSSSPYSSNVSVSDQVAVASLGQQYMDALFHQNYAVMWSMLYPQMQVTWANQDAFAHYLQMRFENYTLQSFSLGKVSQLSFWINPETMVEYKNVEVMPISLRLISQLTHEQQAQLAPQFQQPDQLQQNIPFVVQHVVKQGKDRNDQWFILKGGPADPEAPILPPFAPVSRSVPVPILMYHYISNAPTNDANPVLRQSLSVSPQHFNQQLDYLKQRGFHSITFNQLMNALYYGVSLPSKPIILTFDDGYIDGYTTAYPTLKAHGFSGMFYIITGKVGWRGQMNWDQLREMLSNGMQMGSHTVHHVEMGHIYRASVNLADQELQLSQNQMQDHLGISIQHFCYPNGDPFKGHNESLQQQVVALLAAHGYIDATTDPGPTGIMQQSLAPFVLLRLRVDGRSSLQEFMEMVGG